MLSPSHIIRLLRVPKGNKRLAITLQAIREQWTKSQLEEEIRRRYGRRKKGGRRPRLPGNLPQLLDALESMCDSWVRWYRAITKNEDDQPAEHARLTDLPAGIKKHVDELSRGIKRLLANLHAAQQRERNKRRGK